MLYVIMTTPIAVYYVESDSLLYICFTSYTVIMTTLITVYYIICCIHDLHLIFVIGTSSNAYGTNVGYFYWDWTNLGKEIGEVFQETM